MYYGWIKNENDLLREFSLDASTLVGCTVLFAAYDGDFQGQAIVVFQKGDQLYEVNAWHQSGDHLADQWEPELTTKEALKHRIENGTLGEELGDYTLDFEIMLSKLP